MSFENETREKVKTGQRLERLDLGILTFLWQSGPLSIKKDDSIPKLLSDVSFLKSFTNNELRIFTKYLHKREFEKGDVIFQQGDTGYGFYFVLRGAVAILNTFQDELGERHDHVLAKLERAQYFGEMGLLEEFNRRNASAVCLENTTLLGLFKPDLDDFIDQHPVVGAKFLREISLIIAKRLSALVQEVSILRKRMNELGEHR